MNVFLMGLFALVVLLVLSGFRVLQEYQRGVVFRLGRLAGARGPGLIWLIPLIDRQRVVDIRTITVNVEPQETITRDSVTVRVNAVLWFRVTDPEKAIVAVADYGAAVYQVALTSLRNIIGQHVLDEVLRERDQINDTLRTIVDGATDDWGVEVVMVEMKDVEIPEGMQRAMAREAEAIREKRARIIKAEAELEASVKLMQGAEQMARAPMALELRRMQMLSEIGIDNNTTTVIMMPSEFMSLAKSLGQATAA